jgi:hypothetical protein
MVWTLMGVLATMLFATPVSAATAQTFRYSYVRQSPSQVSADGNAHIVRANQRESIPITVTLNNRSNTVIRGLRALGAAPAGKQVPVGAYGIGVRGDALTPWLNPTSFALNGNRFAYYEGPDVLPGEDFTISWTVTIADEAPTGSHYDLYFRPVYEYKQWTQQVAADGTVLGFNSADIFTRFLIGGAEHNVATYARWDYGFSFDYPYDMTIVADNFASWPRTKTNEVSDFPLGRTVTVASEDDGSYVAVSVWRSKFSRDGDEAYRQLHAIIYSQAASELRAALPYMYSANIGRSDVYGTTFSLKSLGAPGFQDGRKVILLIRGDDLIRVDYDGPTEKMSAIERSITL